MCIYASLYDPDYWDHGATFGAVRYYSLCSHDSLAPCQENPTEEAVAEFQVGGGVSEAGRLRCHVSGCVHGFVLGRWIEVSSHTEISRL